MKNIPQIKLGLAAVSRDCFPKELSLKRRERVLESCRERSLPVLAVEPVIENEQDVLRALEDIRLKGLNALALYLGNFGPEGPTTLLAQRFGGPVMLAAAAEDSGSDLIHGRGDAYCGLLSASYNVGLRRLRPHIPEHPVGTPAEVADLLAEFIPIARVVYGIRRLKIVSFGPRPFDFLTCHSPLQPLHDLGVEVMENSELDLYDRVMSEKDGTETAHIAGQMAEELGPGRFDPDLIGKLARYEQALERFVQDHLGASRFAALAVKCWPAFEKYFGHVPCYVNSRLAARGIPVSCEADLYGALSEYAVVCATEKPPALLDINNTVPRDLYDDHKTIVGGYAPDDLWMGFHCGNVSSSCLLQPALRHQLIMHRLMEPDSEPKITRGTLEGQIQSGPVSIFRIQGTPEARLQAYAAQGEVLPIPPRSFGSIGVFAVREMGRFYRHVLIEKRFPHHTAVAFAHAGRTLFAACRMLGIDDLSYNHPPGLPYPTENPF